MIKLAFSCKVGKRIINIFDETEETFRKWSKEGKLRCIHEGCKTPIMRYANGDYKMPYFSHIDNSGCDFSEDDYGRESGKYNSKTKREHSLGQYKLAGWIRKIKGVTDLQLEKIIEETNQRADIYFKYNNKEYVIEYQCTPQATKYNERHELYRLNKINDIWIFGTKKYGIEELLKEDKDKGEINFKVAEKQQLLENNRILYYNPFKDLFIKIEAQDLTLACREQNNGDITLLKNTFIIEKYNKNKLEVLNNIEYLLKHEVNEEVVNYINACLELKGGFTFKYEKDNGLMICSKKGYTKMKDEDGIETFKGEIQIELNEEDIYWELKYLINKEISIENLRKNKQKIINMLNRYDIKWKLRHVLYEDLYIIFYRDYKELDRIGMLNSSKEEIIKCIEKNIAYINEQKRIEEEKREKEKKRIEKEKLKQQLNELKEKKKVSLFIKKYNKLYNQKITSENIPCWIKYNICNLSPKEIVNYYKAPYKEFYFILNPNNYKNDNKDVERILHHIYEDKLKNIYEDKGFEIDTTFNNILYKEIPIYNYYKDIKGLSLSELQSVIKKSIHPLDFDSVKSNIDWYFGQDNFNFLYKQKYENYFTNVEDSICIPYINEYIELSKIVKGELTWFEIDFMYHRYQAKLKEEKNIEIYKNIFNIIEERYDKNDGVKNLYRDGKYVRITLRNWEHIVYEMNPEINIGTDIESVYEEISTMIRNGLYPIDK